MENESSCQHQDYACNSRLWRIVGMNLAPVKDLHFTVLRSRFTSSGEHKRRVRRSLKDWKSTTRRAHTLPSYFRFTGFNTHCTHTYGRNHVTPFAQHPHVLADIWDGGGFLYGVPHRIDLLLSSAPSLESHRQHIKDVLKRGPLEMGSFLAASSSSANSSGRNDVGIWNIALRWRPYRSSWLQGRVGLSNDEQMRSLIEFSPSCLLKFTTECTEFFNEKVLIKKPLKKFVICTFPSTQRSKC